MIDYVKKSIYLLSSDQKKSLPFLVLLFLGMSFLDLIGISLIGPYIAMVIDEPATSSFVSKMLDMFGLEDGKEVLLTKLGWSLVLIFLIKTVSAILINHKIISFGQDQQVFLRRTLMSSYQALPYVDYLRGNSSEYVYAMEQLAGRAQAVTIILLRIMSDSIVAILIICFLATQNLLALCLLVALLGISVFSYDKIFRVRMKIYGREANQAATEMVQSLNEGVEGLKEIRIFGKEHFFHKQVTKATRKLAYYQTNEMVIHTVPRFLMEFLMVCFIVILVVGTIYLNQSLQMLVPTLAMFGVAGLRLLPIANMLSGNVAVLRFHRDSIIRLFNELKRFENFELMYAEKRELNTHVFNSITLKNICFTYPNSTKNALSNISLSIGKGESVGFIGSSGSGKTTLINVLLGLLNPNSGSILVNNKNIDNFSGLWRSHVAYLPQQVFLVDNSIRRNIALGCEDDEIDDNKVIKAISKARLSEFFSQLPDGLDSRIGERGARLSGGEKQRIALARAFYFERDVIVLDEATSALDIDTESKIVDEIKMLKGEKTLIFIAHRHSTLEHCDKIYHIKSGKIVNQGKPHKVL